MYNVERELTKKEKKQISIEIIKEIIKDLSIIAVAGVFIYYLVNNIETNNFNKCYKQYLIDHNIKTVDYTGAFSKYNKIEDLVSLSAKVKKENKKNKE